MWSENKERLLTPELYRRDPLFFRQAIAYRLMHMFTPKPLTRLLPKGLMRPLLGKGCIWPAEIPPVPGVIIPPGVTMPANWPKWLVFAIEQAKLMPGVFPPSWNPEDKLPPGVSWNTYYIFPEGWTMDDPFPPGIVQEAGAVWPAGWVRGDPLPPGFSYDATTIIPEGWSPDTPPVTMPPVPPSPPEDNPPWSPFPDPPWEPIPPGPPHGPAPGPTGKTYEIELTAENDAQVVNAQTTWDATRNNEAGILVEQTNKYSASSVLVDQGAGYYRIWRSFYHWNLQWMPSYATIKSCTFQLYGAYSEANTITVQKATHELYFPLETFGAIEGGSLCTQDWTAGVNEFVLNQDGIAVIQASVGGYARLCIREDRHDCMNIVPPEGTQYKSGYYYREATDPVRRPKLKITYKA